MAVDPQAIEVLMQLLGRQMKPGRLGPGSNMTNVIDAQGRFPDPNMLPDNLPINPQTGWPYGISSFAEPPGKSYQAPGQTQIPDFLSRQMGPIDPDVGTPPGAGPTPPSGLGAALAGIKANQQYQPGLFVWAVSPEGKRSRVDGPFQDELSAQRSLRQMQELNKRTNNNQPSRLSFIVGPMDPPR